VYVDILPKCHQKFLPKGLLTMSAHLFSVTVKDRTCKHSFSPCWQITYNHKTERFIWPQMWTRFKKLIKISRNSFLQNQCIICIYITYTWITYICNLCFNNVWNRYPPPPSADLQRQKCPLIMQGFLGMWRVGT
jgi:hypothetical protein